MKPQTQVGFPLVDAEGSCVPPPASSVWLQQRPEHLLQGEGTTSPTEGCNYNPL